MINRHIKTQINEAIKHFPVVIVTGPRQVGKSTLLYNEFVKSGYNYVSLDDISERNLAINSPKTFLDNNPCPLIIDEAQKAPELFDEIEKNINQVRLKKGNKAAAGMYIISGSTRHMLLEKAEESLAGRCAIISMFPLSVAEIYKNDNHSFLSDLSEINKRTKKTGLELDKIYKLIIKGFLPFLYDDKKANTSLFYSSYINTYLEKDLRDILDISDELKFINFFKLLASNVSQELVYDNYSKDIGVDSKTIKAWISALVKTGVVYLIEPYNENSIKKRIVKRPKLYFFDTGLVCHLLGIDSEKTLINSFLKGRIFENAAINEIKKSFINNGVNQTLYYYRDSNKNEIDLVYVNDGKLNRIEIKAGTNFSINDVSSFKQLDATKWKIGNKAIVCTIDKLSAIDNDVYLIPISSI